MPNVVSISAFLLPLPIEGQERRGALGKGGEKSEASANWARVTWSRQVLPPRLPLSVLEVGAAVHLQPLQPSPRQHSLDCQRQISSIVSSLSAFSNHSHGFALFILIVLLIIRVILCLQLSQRSQGLAVSNHGLGTVCRLTPHSSTSIDFPSV